MYDENVKHMLSMSYEAHAQYKLKGNLKNLKCSLSIRLKLYAMAEQHALFRQNTSKAGVKISNNQLSF